MRNNPLCKLKDAGKNDKRSCLDGVDVSNLLWSLPCNPNDNMNCDQMKYLTEESFQTFLNSSDKTHSDSKKTTVRTIAKSFVPRTCASNKNVNVDFSLTPTETKVNEYQGNRFSNFLSHRTTRKNEKEKMGHSLTPPELDDKNQCAFKTAREELHLQNLKQGNNATAGCSSNGTTGGQKRKLGYRRTVRSKFISPMLSNPGSSEDLPKSDEWLTDEGVDERLKNIDPKMIELIKSEIMDCGSVVQWDDIAGLESVKSAIQEAVVWPLLRPDIFTGLRKPPKGILLFGPPGTGKTLIGKCVASQSKSTFFSISASSLTSKWIGEGEKMVRALFGVATVHQPAVIFIDEVDSLLSQRSETEHESSRRLKTEFLVRLDGATTGSDDRVLVIGATNRPQELDEAARRRFVKRLYIPLPEFQARLQIVSNLMSKERNSLTYEDMHKIAELSDGYSGADMKNLCSEASLGPIRSISMNQMETIQANEVLNFFYFIFHCLLHILQVRSVDMNDFKKALTFVRSSVSPKDLNQYIEWNQVYGSGCVI
ncbi:hypothetical protein FQR65_LT08435 [Abscondita terminalis]|nr:hypothetical protein FQR65_LT08435 [Abscondita terminalis]